jgi:hypothetical protein
MVEHAAAELHRDRITDRNTLAGLVRAHVAAKSKDQDHYGLQARLAGWLQPSSYLQTFPLMQVFVLFCLPNHTEKN